MEPKAEEIAELIEKKSKAPRRGKEEWKNFIAEQCRSGSVVQEFCKRHGIRCNQFYYWKKKLEKGRKFVEVLPEMQLEETPRKSTALRIFLFRLEVLAWHFTVELRRD